MDLVGIMHMVDMPSAGKHDFNYLCSWFDIVHSVPLGISFLCGTVHIDFLPFHNVHPMSLVSSYLFNVHVLSGVMHPVDMGRFILPLCFII